MSGNYVADKISRGSLCYGLATFHAGNGKFVRQAGTRAQLALGVGRYNGLRKLAYSGIDIPSQYYRFHNDGANPSDDYFPLDVPHLGWSWTNFEIPGAMGSENDLSKIVGIAECRKVADYNGSGGQVDLSWSQNAARIAVDGIKLFTGSPNYVDFGSYLEYKAFCDELISVNINGQNVQQERFKINLVFLLQQSITLEQFLNRVCELSCTDWQWSRGKIRFLPPTNANQQPKFDFSLTKVAQEFKFQAHTFKNRYNGVEVAWRDENDSLLREQQPIIVDRRANNNVPKRFYTFDYGVGRKHQVERFAHCTARLRCDLPDYAFIRGSWKSYHVLPGDVVTLSHPTADWTEKRCKVIKKNENEESGIGYNYSLQVQPSEPYSDTDTSPLVTRTAVIGANPYTPPPVPTFTLTPDSALGADGTNYNFIKGVVTFGTYGLKQRAKVYWMKPGGSYQELDTLEPLNNQAHFQAPNPPSGDNWFKVVAYSELGAKIDPPLNDQKFTVNPKIFYVNGFPVPDLIFRGTTAIKPDGQMVGRDNAKVPVAAIEAQIDSADVVAENVWVTLSVTIKELGNDANGNRIHHQADVAYSQVEYFNQYGESIKKFAPVPIVKRVSQPVASVPRKYADVLDGQGWFRISINNIAGDSNFVYLKGTVLTTVEPTKKQRTQMPQEFAAVPTNQGLRFTFQHGGSGTVFRRPLTTKIEGWQYITSGVSPLDYTLPANDEAEYMTTNPNDGNLRSNYIRAKTLPQAAPASPFTAPLGVSLSLDAQFPSAIVNISISLGVNDKPTNLYNNGNYIGQLSAGQSNYNFSGRSAGETVSITARHDYGSGNHSEPCAAQEITTYNPPPAILPPTIHSAGYDTQNQRTFINFEPRGGSNNFTVDISYDNGANWQRLYTNEVPANVTHFNHQIAQQAYLQNVRYRIARHDQSGFSESYPVEIPAQDAFEHPQVSNAYVSQLSGSGATIEGTFTPQGGNGGFSVVFGDYYNGYQAQTLFANQNYFSFQVIRGFNWEIKYIWIYRDDVYSQNEPVKYQIEIPGTFGGEMQ